MRKMHTVVPTCGVIPIEEIQEDTSSRDDIPRMILALKSI